MLESLSDVMAETNRPVRLAVPKAATNDAVKALVTTAGMFILYIWK